MVSVLANYNNPGMDCFLFLYSHHQMYIKKHLVALSVLLRRLLASVIFHLFYRKTPPLYYLQVRGVREELEESVGGVCVCVILSCSYA